MAISEFKESNFSRVVGVEARLGSVEVRQFDSDIDYTLKKLGYDRTAGWKMVEGGTGSKEGFLRFKYRC